MTITVQEASEAYAGAMSNTLPVGQGICSGCRTFIDPGYLQCIQCNRQPETLDLVVPITYSVNMGQMHHALRSYKEASYPPSVRRYAQTRLAAILWRFLDAHEACIAASVGVPDFDVVTVVPSTSPERDKNSPLRMIVSWCTPVADRLEAVLVPTGNAASSHTFDSDRYAATRELGGARVLLIDDTWTTGAHARSAAETLRDAGASTVAAVVIGRHVSTTWEVAGRTTDEFVKDLPPFDWDRCCVGH